MTEASKDGTPADEPLALTAAAQVTTPEAEPAPGHSSVSQPSETTSAAHHSPSSNDASSLTRKTAKLQIDTGSSTDAPQTKTLPASPPPPQPPSEQDKPYLDPTPNTPTISRHPSTRSAGHGGNEKTSAADGESGEKGENVSGKGAAAGEDDNESVSEIQSIMDQFTDETIAPSKDEIMSPRHEMKGPILDAATPFPPRRSSLEPLRSRDMDVIAQPPVAVASEKNPTSPPPVPPKSGVPYAASPIQKHMTGSSTSLSKQLPDPEPEPELPFDFHRFLEQLRHKSADPVAKFLRSFLNEFGKKQWMVHEQVKIIGDFLTFITNKMAQCDVWREVSDNEFDNAKEGMEKLVMNRLYSQTFSPAIAPPPSTRGRGKRKEPERSTGPGRRGQHQEDVERDEILAQKIRIYSWVREEHLDITPVGPNGERFLRLAQQELLKIKGYRAPRDKVICILNSCKVIFGLLKNASTSDTSADSFVPLLIFVVLQSNPEHLVSNIQYILRFRNQDKLSGEAGYYLSSLSGAIQFIESLDRTTLTVSDEDFERHVELAVSAIAEQNREQEPASARPRISEKSALSEAEVTPRNSVEVTSSSPRKKSQSRDGRPRQAISPDGTDDEPGVAGLLRTIQKPLSSIGRMFSDQDGQDEGRSDSGTPHRKASPAGPPLSSDPTLGPRPPRAASAVRSYDAQEAAARQATAESAEARRIQRAEHKTVVDTLCGMFPNLDREVIDDVVRQKQGRVGLAVDACLALTAGG